MSVRPVRSSLDRPTTLAVLAAIVGSYVGALAAYLGVADVAVTAPRYYGYPLVWLLVAAWVVLRAPSPDRRRPRAAGIALVYLIALLVTAGTLSAGGTGTGVDVRWLAPGWGPLIAYDGHLVTVGVVPFQVVGLLSLSYLAFVAVARASERSAAVGLVGLASCVGCVWPVLAAVGTALGGGGAVAASVGPLSYDLATALYVGTALLMYALLARDSSGFGRSERVSGRTTAR